MHQAIEALPLDGDPAALIARVEALSRTRCFALLEQGVSLPTRSALALKTYWKDGGRQHLRSYLDLGRPGMRPLFQPPSLRRTMGEVYRVGHPLASLVCPPAERSCGAETAAWGLRLQTVLDGPAPAGVCEHHPVPAPDGCGRLALRAPASQRFRRFADCVYHARPSRRVPALGRLRALAGGWLIVSGVGLTRDGCDEDRAFDLASGAIFRVSSCIVLDTQRVDLRARRVEVEVGWAPVTSVRTAAWMLLLLESFQDERLTGAAALVPPAVTPVLAPFVDSETGTDSGQCEFSSHRATLDWRVMTPIRLLGAGAVAKDQDRAANHALELLREADAGFVPGCPPATLPASPVNPAKLDDRTRALAEGWRRALARAEACGAR